MKPIQVVPYDPKWPFMFEQEANKLKSALGSNCVAIHHVGSTAVPGLASKPTIDIIAGVKDLVFDYKGLSDLNYEYRGGFNLPLRKCFTYRSPELNVNLHIFEKDDPEIELNLLFRDYLKTHLEARDEYAALKYKLLKDNSSYKKEGQVLKGYTMGKYDLIQNILRQTEFKGLRFVICTHNAELEAAKRFRNDYFFRLNNAEDPYNWTFKHNNHKHFILYKGVDIVGYSHIQLFQSNLAAIQIILIKEKHQGKGYGKKFISLIEKWTKLESYNIINDENTPAN